MARIGDKLLLLLDILRKGQNGPLGEKHHQHKNGQKADERHGAGDDQQGPHALELRLGVEEDDGNPVAGFFHSETVVVPVAGGIVA